VHTTCGPFISSLGGSNSNPLTYIFLANELTCPEVCGSDCVYYYVLCSCFGFLPHDLYALPGTVCSCDRSEWSLPRCTVVLPQLPSCWRRRWQRRDHHERRRHSSSRWRGGRFGRGILKGNVNMHFCPYTHTPYIHTIHTHTHTHHTYTHTIHTRTPYTHAHIHTPHTYTHAYTHTHTHSTTVSLAGSYVLIAKKSGYHGNIQRSSSCSEC